MTRSSSATVAGRIDRASWRPGLHDHATPSDALGVLRVST
jgi:hypothetical protein